jgi:hypothetical protein
MTFEWPSGARLPRLMRDLIIRIKKKSDGSAALSCTRADGSVTWQRQDGQLGQVFPMHDLTHYCVESVIGFRRGFYGLLAEGWDISDFGKVGARGPIPEEARLVEMIVGYFDLEQRTGILGAADEYNERIITTCADNKVPGTSFRLTDEHVARVRARRADLFARWRALASGDTLEVTFDRAEAPVLL